VIAAVPTMFASDGTVDLEGTGKYFEWVASRGVDALFVTGAMGEFTTLTVAERIAVIEVASRVVGPDLVIAHVGAATTAVAEVIARETSGLGVRRMAACPPFGVSTGLPALIGHFQSVADAAGPADVLAYIFAEYTGTPVTAADLRELARQAPLVGAKISGEPLGEVKGYLAAVPDDFVILTGREADFPDLVRAGGVGIVSGIASSAPEVFVAIRESMSPGPVPEDLLERLAELTAAFGGGAGMIKAVLSKRIGTSRTTRLPGYCRAEQVDAVLALAERPLAAVPSAASG
jgi:4-hydroxy-tetrahydrodipicolinate synthase